MGGSAAPPADWKGMQQDVKSAANQQVQNNRLNTSSPFASQTFLSDGGVTQQFNGGLGQASMGLMDQAGQLGKAMDWSQFGTLGNGDQARQQAVDAAYGQATSRLDPMWDRREEQMRTRLLNQGLDPNSEAYKNAMSDITNARTDAYNQAMFSAIGQGTSAGDSAFRNNMTARQQAITEALRKRGMPLQELQMLQGFLGQPTYNQDNTTLAGQMGVAGMAQNAAQQDWQQQQAKAAQEASTAGGIMSGIGTAAGIAAMFL